MKINLEDKLRFIGGFFKNLIMMLVDSYKDYEIVLYSLFFTVFFIVVLSTLLYYKVKNSRFLKSNINNLDTLLSSLDTSKGFDKSLNEILKVFNSVITAYGYAFYVYDEKSRSYILKAVRYLIDGESDIAPSYSGLLPYEKETYIPPFSMSMDSIPQTTCIVIEGKVPLIAVPVKGNKGMIRIGPKKALPKRLKVQLDMLGNKLQPVLNMLVEMERLKNRVEVVVAANDAMHNLSKIIADERGIINTLMGICIKALNATGGFFYKEKNDGMQLMAACGWDERAIEILNNDASSALYFRNIMKNDSTMFLEKSDSGFQNLPEYFFSSGLDSLYLINIFIGNNYYIGGIWYKKNLLKKEEKDQKLTELITMANRMEAVLKNQYSISELSDNYLDMLKKLAQLLDSQSPYTVGYSDLMYRYSYIIAKDMGLQQNEIKEIATAAFLSNIGLLGLTKDMLVIEGRYTELEYELMKLHSDVGASIIEASVSNDNIAACIRHHHERIDGFGYPSGLKGEEIPVGARIIAVVQTFLAKITGRSDRAPLLFDQALSVLKSASGTQLDPLIVDVLINWFRRKQKNSSTGRALGDCWEMRCSTESICISCPAYKNHEKNCWENSGVNCEAHGNKCETCFVHSEFMNRKV